MQQTKGDINMKRIEMEIRDHEIACKCTDCCLTCKKYKTIKEQNQKCEVRKARGKIINRRIYKLKSLK